MKNPWVVIEAAGTDDEHEITDFPTMGAAIKWADKSYGADYREQGVDVMRRQEDGTLTSEY